MAVAMVMALAIAPPFASPPLFSPCSLRSIPTALHLASNNRVSRILNRSFLKTAITSARNPPPSNCHTSRRTPDDFVAESAIDQCQMSFDRDVIGCCDDPSGNVLKTLFKNPFVSSVFCATSFFADSPASASTKFTDDEWLHFWITWAVVAILYFFVIPLIVFNYLRLRWYKRKLPEALFQFLLVFLFFPGMLLLAPFINFRRLPRDPSKAP